MRARLTPGELPGRGRQSHVAFTLYDRVLCGVSRSPPCPAPARPTAVVVSRLEAEADEMWSFVQQKANKQWIWIAMDAKTRQIMAFHVGDRSHKSAEHLWAKIPQAHRQHATFYTDQYVVYEKVMPAAQHQAISKLARKTNHIKRFNNTLRQRVSRLVREAWSFSKKLANHSGAIKLFIGHYNLTRVAA